MRMRRAVMVCLWLGCSATWGQSDAQGPRPEAMGSAARQPASGGKRNVLILHSYHSTFPWTEELTRGIQSALTDRPYEVEIWNEYMDSKRASAVEQRELLERSLARKYSSVPLDLIITTDDDALAFMQNCPIREWCKKPVVYCGVSNMSLIREVDRERFTGLEETVNPGNFVKAGLRMWPKTRRLVVVNDNSQVGLAQRGQFADEAKHFPQLEFQFLDASTMPFPAVLDRLRKLPPDSLVIAGMFTHDNEGRYLPPNDTGRLIAQAAPVPVISRNTSVMGQGFLAGNSNQGFEHGRRAGLMAVRVLSGEQPSAIPLEAHGQVQLVIDEKVAERWGVKPSSYPPGSIVVNKANGWMELYEDHKTVFWLVLGLALLQSGIIAALVANRIKRRRAEAALRESQAHLERAQKIAKVGSWEVDGDTGAVQWSDAVFELYGEKPQAFVPTFERFLELVHPMDRQRVRDLVNRSERDQENRSLEYRILRRDGKVHYIRSYGEWQPETNGRRMLAGVVQDITELREMEEQFRHSQRVESLGTLAGGIAHDFNNLLTIINGYSQMLMMRLAPADKAQSAVREIHRAGERAADLTRQLLAFSRKQVLQPKVLDLNEVITSLEGLLRPLLGGNIELETRLHAGARHVLADRSQLEQVIVNLAANARDAMPEGGTLRLETRNQDISGYRSTDDVQMDPGPYVELLVMDTGAGIEEEVRHRIFEPFFTTKPAGKGTGLGLATVYGIVRQSGGYIAVSSEMGRGSTFRILFPAAQGEMEEVVASQPALLPGTGRVLIVDDEDQIRTLAAHTLGELGYQVITAGSSAEAMSLEFDLVGGPPELVIADIVMPGGSGIEMARKLRGRYPMLKVLYMSGYAGDHFDLSGEPPDSFLAKPFLPGDLAAKVKELLSKPSRI